MDDKSPQFARCKPVILTSAMQEFSSRAIASMSLKVGVPVTMAYVEALASAGTFVHTRAEALQLYRQAAAAAAKTFLFLSAGVSNRAFTEALQLAFGSRSPFFAVSLCGRATGRMAWCVCPWWRGMRFRNGFENPGRQNMQSINEASGRHAVVGKLSRR